MDSPSGDLVLYRRLRQDHLIEKPAFLTSGLLQRRIHPPLLGCAWSGSLTYCQVRLRPPPGARLVLAAPPALRDDNR